MGQSVKTAISLRRELFEQAETLAKELHVPRSRLFAVALENFMRRRRNRRLLDDINAAHKQWEFGIGPGCTGVTTVVDKETGEESEVFTGQAIPPVRIREVCESLNETDEDGNTKTRCCIESICDDDFSPAVDCLTGIIQDAVTPVG